MAANLPNALITDWCNLGSYAGDAFLELNTSRGLGGAPKQQWSIAVSDNMIDPADNGRLVFRGQKGGPNPATIPLMLDPNGGVIIPGNVSTGGQLYTQTGVSLIDSNGVTHGRTSLLVGGNTLVQADDSIEFRKLGEASGNTTLTLSAANADDDILSVGGTITAKRLDLLGAAAPNANASVGSASIAVGATNIVIPTTAVTATSKIFLSKVGPAAAGPANGVAQGNFTYDPADIIPGVSFIVQLVDPATGVIVAASTTSADFVWMIVG